LRAASGEAALVSSRLRLCGARSCRRLACGGAAAFLMYFLYCSLLSQSFQRSLLAFPRPRRESGCKGRGFLRSRQTLRRKNRENKPFLTFVHCRRGGKGRNAQRSHYYIYAPRGSGTRARTTEALKNGAWTATLPVGTFFIPTDKTSIAEEPGNISVGMKNIPTGNGGGVEGGAERRDEACRRANQDIPADNHGGTVGRSRHCRPAQPPFPRGGRGADVRFGQHAYSPQSLLRQRAFILQRAGRQSVGVKAWFSYASCG